MTSEQQDSEGSQPANRPAKSWLARSLGTLMQLPNSTPLAALRWTDPEGPMPRIVHLPSRDTGRTVEVYIWVPPAASAKIETPPPSRASTSKEGATPLPIQSSFTGALRPCVVDFHGGGFIMGGPLEQAPWCSALARSGIIAISVAYRLGPTHGFPAALLDSEDVVRAVFGGNKWYDKEASEAIQKAIDMETGKVGAISIDTSKVGMSGFSSGGNVALNMLLDLPGRLLSDSSSDWPSPFAPSHRSSIPTLLFFPSLDARQAPHERKRPASMAPAGGVSKFIGRTLRNAYLPLDQAGHLRASPGLAPTSSIHSSTRALLILPEMDTLAEQSEVWVNKLHQAGLVQQAADETGSTIGETLQGDACAIRVHRIKSMSHGFTTFPDSFIDVPTRRVKQLVMEQSRRWIIGMFGGDAGDVKESEQRVEDIVEGLTHGQGVKQPTARIAKAIE